MQEIGSETLDVVVDDDEDDDSGQKQTRHELGHRVSFVVTIGIYRDKQRCLVRLPSHRYGFSKLTQGGVASAGKYWAEPICPLHRSHAK